MNRISSVLVCLVAPLAACEPTPSEELFFGCGGPATQADYDRAQDVIDRLDRPDGTDPVLRFCSGTHAAPSFASLRPITVEPADGGGLGDVVLDGDSAWTTPGLTMSRIEVTGELSFEGSALSLADVAASTIWRTLPDDATTGGAATLERVQAGHVDLGTGSTVRVDDVVASSLVAYGMDLEVARSSFDRVDPGGPALYVFGDDIVVIDSVLRGAYAGLGAVGTTVTIEGTDISSTDLGAGAAVVVGVDVVLRDTSIWLDDEAATGPLVLSLSGAGESSIALDHVTFGPSLSPTQGVVGLLAFEELESQTLTVTGVEWGGSVARYIYTEESVDLPTPASDFTCTTGPSAESLHCETH